MSHAATDPPDTVIVRPVTAGERSVWQRRRRRLADRVSRSLVAVPACYLAGAVALGVLMPALDRSRADHEYLLGIDASSARSVLESVASGMITFSGLVVSVAVLVVQFGAGQYSPRLVQIFRRDPVIKHALGLFAAPGLYALVAVANVAGRANDRPESLTVLVALILMLVALIALFRFIGRLLDLMRPRRIYARLLEGVRPAIEEVYPFGLEDPVRTVPRPAGAVAGVVRNDHRDGVLAAIEVWPVVRAAAAADVVLTAAAQIGSMVAHEAPLLCVHGGGVPDGATLHRAMTLADGRSIRQDPAFAIRCVVDVAIRALSPAVNDPTSAVEGLDALDALLHRLASRRLEDAAVTGEDGAVRLLLVVPGWEALLDLALTEIRVYGAGTPQVARRMRALLDGLGEQAPSARRPAVARHLALLDDAVARQYVDPAERRLASVPDRVGLGGGATWGE